MGPAAPYPSLSVIEVARPPGTSGGRRKSLFPVITHAPLDFDISMAVHKYAGSGGYAGNDDGDAVSGDGVSFGGDVCFGDD